MALAIVQHSNGIHTSQVPGVVTLAAAPTAGNLIIAFIGCNLLASNVTLGTGWTRFDAAYQEGTDADFIMQGLYRYAQVGDTAALPAIATAGTTYWTHQIYEISGVSGTWDSDMLSSIQMGVSQGTNSIPALPIFASGLALTAFSRYNGNANATISGSWTLDDASNNNANFGSAAGAHRAVSNGDTLDGAWSGGGASVPFGGITLVLTASRPATGKPIIRHMFQKGAGTGFPGAFTPPWTPKQGCLQICYLLWGNGAAANATINTTDWTNYKNATDGSSKNLVNALYRYAGASETTLKAPATAGATNWYCMFVELDGVHGTFSQDHVSSKSGTQASGATLATTSDTTTAADQLAILGFGNFSGTGISTTTGFSFYGTTFSDNASYGSLFSSFKYFSAGGGSVGGTITPSNTTTTQSYVQDIFFGSAATETGTGSLAFSGLELTASGSAKNAGTGTLSFSGFSISAAGDRIRVKATGALAFSGLSIAGIGARVHVLGTGVLSFGGIKYVATGAITHVKGTGVLSFGRFTISATGSDIVSPAPPVPPTPPTITKQTVAPWAWNVPIVNDKGYPSPEFMRKFESQNVVNQTVVPQNYIDAQNAAAIANGQDYTVSYGATVLVAAKAYTDSQPPNPLPEYTVATLPAGVTVGKQAIVTDALTPAYLTAVVGGGAVITPVIWNGTAWVCH